jgi:hypothetical protein
VAGVIAQPADLFALTAEQHDLLVDVMRRRIRKLDKTIARFRPKQGQTRAEQRFFLAKFRRDRELAAATLRALGGREEGGVS